MDRAPDLQSYDPYDLGFDTAEWATGDREKRQAGIRAEAGVEVRHRYVHRADPVTVAHAQGGYDSAMGLIEELLQPLASRVRLE
jgi:fructose 1,6-bisphosphatase